ncbi:acetate uptake transporter [Nocardioides sp.]|uniref:acetate uptake transporter n=1 Tax=Nocardioides sp. TaxID=35761 RepID=UPI002631622F|nr:acetate uptake transporter [Nocardioides sp.]
MTAMHASVPAARTSPESAPAATGASFADPGPLGLAAFALTTFILSFANADIIKAEPVVFGVALFYGGIVQILAGMWEFVKGNTFGATAFASYGGFWLAFWYLATRTDLSSFAPAEAQHGVGLFLLGWTIFTAYMWISSFRTNTALVVVFTLLTITFAFLTLGDLTTTPNLTKIGGFVGIATAVVAWYTSFAGVANSTFGRTVLPTGAPVVRTH